MVFNLLLSHLTKFFSLEQTQATPLYMACEKGHLKLVKYLLGVGAPVDVLVVSGMHFVFAVVTCVFGVPCDFTCITVH